MRVGIAGTGRMGTAYARRLVETGHEVAVWNRSLGRTADAHDAGAEVVGSLADLAEREAVIVSVRDRAAAEAVINGLASAGLSGTVVVEMSTLLPEDQEALAASVRAAGGGFVDCPVGGTVAPALKGALLGMAGGAESDLSKVRPVLDDLCKRVEHLGPVGSGARMKLAVNLPLALYWAGLAESLAVLEGSGLPGETIASVLADSSAGPAVLKNRMDVVAKAIDGTDTPGTFDIDGLAKDLALALEWGRRQGATMPLAGAAQGLYEAARAAGMGGLDGASLARFAALR